MRQSTNARNFYVYVLFRPWDGSPFYIGKGRGARWLDHERERGRRNKHVAAIVTKAIRLGLEIPKVKIRQHLTEVEAFAIERAFIGAIGRKSHGGPLANGTDGGDGSSGHHVPKEIASRSSERMKALWRDPVWRANNVARLQGNTNTRGRKLTVEHRTKISKAGTGKPGVWRGKKFSAAHRASLSAAISAHWRNVRRAETPHPR